MVAANSRRQAPKSVATNISRQEIDSCFGACSRSRQIIVGIRLSADSRRRKSDQLFSRDLVRRQSAGNRSTIGGNRSKFRGRADTSNQWNRAARDKHPKRRRLLTSVGLKAAPASQYRVGRPSAIRSKHQIVGGPSIVGHSEIPSARCYLAPLAANRAACRGLFERAARPPWALSRAQEDGRRAA